MMNTDAVPDRNIRHSSSGVMAAPMAPRLFGRAREQAALLSAYEAAETGKTVFVLIEGPAGIGKSALVADFRETLPNGTLFAAGRFEEPEHIPFRGLRQALSGAARHLLAQDSLTLAVWRRRLDDALRPNRRPSITLRQQSFAAVGPSGTQTELLVLREQMCPTPHGAADTVPTHFGQVHIGRFSAGAVDLTKRNCPSSILCNIRRLQGGIHAHQRLGSKIQSCGQTLRRAA